MIERITVNGVHTAINDDLSRYAKRKIGKLDRFISRHARESVHVEIMLKENKVRDKKNFTCEVIFHAPQERLTVSETTMNMYAAIDIVEEKLKNQLQRHKDKQNASHKNRRSLIKWLRKAPSEAQKLPE